MENIGCANEDCKLFDHCRPDLNGVPPCANNKELAQLSHNNDYAAALSSILNTVSDKMSKKTRLLILNRFDSHLHSLKAAGEYVIPN